MPLCTRRRDKLSARPLPGWTILSAMILAAVMVLAFGKFPAAIMAGVAFDRRLQAEDQGKYALAEREYGRVTRQYPDSTEAAARPLLSVTETQTIHGDTSVRNRLSVGIDR